MRAKGMAPPSKEPEPEVVEPYLDLIWVWNAFWRLSASRPVSMNGPLRLPPSEIKAYADIQEWAGEKVRDFLYYIDVLDESFMGHVMDGQEKQRKEAEQKSKQNANRQGVRR